MNLAEFARADNVGRTISRITVPPPAAAGAAGSGRVANAVVTVTEKPAQPAGGRR
jgi:hypothetical protein